MKNILFMLLCLFLCKLTRAQTFSCSYNGSTEVINAMGFENDDLDEDAYDVTALVNRIIDAYNLPSSKIKVIASTQVNNALATTKDGSPYILYNKYFVENMLYKSDGHWRLFGIFAHEVGHHILFHTMANNTSRRDLELEADKWAGAALYKLKATASQAVMCVEESNEKGSLTHPPRAERKMAVLSGWEEARTRDTSLPTNTFEYIENAAETFIVMKKIPGGTFTMGSNESNVESYEKPAHTVTLSGF